MTRDVWRPLILCRSGDGVGETFGKLEIIVNTQQGGGPEVLDELFGGRWV